MSKPLYEVYESKVYVVELKQNVSVIIHLVLLCIN